MREHYQHKTKQAKQTQENIEKFLAEGGKIKFLEGCKLTERVYTLNHSGEKQAPGYDTMKKVSSDFSDIHKRHFRR